MRAASWRWLVVLALSGLALALRLPALGQSLFADELSTWWIVSTQGFEGVLSTVHSDAEITPPVFFLLAELTTRIDLSAELLRLPSLIAGGATVPLTYALGGRTVGREAGLVAAALVAVSPFLVFYSTEARGYQVAVALVLASTVALLAAVDSGRTRWWVVYAASAWAAVLTHYTTVFVLAAQLGWLIWAHPGARRAALTATGAAALAFLPWVTGLTNDFSSPTTDILNEIDVLTWETLWRTLEHWAIGHPLILPGTPLRKLPGTFALVLFALALVLIAGGAIHARKRLRLDRRFALVAALALAGPAGIVLASLVGTNIVSVRHLATSWPALALLAGGLITRVPRPVGFAALALIVATLAIGTGRLFESRFAKPDYDAVARDLERQASASDLVIDGTSFSPAPISALDAALERPRDLVRLGIPRIQYRPTFKIIGPPPPAGPATKLAVASAPRKRVFIVTSESPLDRVAPPADPFSRQILDALPRGYRRTGLKTYPGFLRLALQVYESPPG